MTLLRRTALFSLFCAAVVVLFWPTLQALYLHSQVDNTASHVVLIPAISLGLVLMRRHEIFRTIDTAWVWGGGLVLVGAALALTNESWYWRG